MSSIWDSAKIILYGGNKPQPQPFISLIENQHSLLNLDNGEDALILFNSKEISELFFIRLRILCVANYLSLADKGISNSTIEIFLETLSVDWAY